MTDAPPAISLMLAQAADQLREGALEGAVEAFSACLLVAPEESEAWRGRATARFQLKDWAGAEADFARARALHAADPQSSVGYGMSLAMQLKIYPAIGVLEDVIERWPEFPDGYIQLGLLQFKLGAIARGRELLMEALRHRPALAQRRLIEETLRQQTLLDKRRCYRPDFERLRKQG